MKKKSAAGGPLKLATWNVNSVRRMAPTIERLVAEESPDILCLQETKVENGLFPRELFERLGYPHVEIHGQKMHHGVAIASRMPLGNATRTVWTGKDDCRHIGVELPGGIELHNFYVPAGGDIPDPKLNPKFDHKLRFVDEMIAWSKKRATKANRTIMLGDLNIAPLATDVWSHKQLLKVVSHTPVETEAMERLRTSGKWVDVLRHFVPAEQNIYTWWSYRSPDWAAADKGRRLDHVWVTPPLQEALISAHVRKDYRGAEVASDHAPMIVTLKP